MALALPHCLGSGGRNAHDIITENRTLAILGLPLKEEMEQKDGKSLQKLSGLRREHKELINLMPLQTGGILTDVAREALTEFADGYSVCDFCQGVLCNIANPPIREFVQEILPGFLGCEVAAITHGAREAKFMVMHSLAEPGDSILVDGNRHYTTFVAAERAGLRIVEVPSSGHPEFRIDVNEYEPIIRKHAPRLILLTYPDGNYGNLPDAIRLGEIAQQYKIPYMVNGAYAVGRMPIRMEEIGADFIVGSGHKSMASAGPVGVLGMKKQWEQIVLRKSTRHSNKDVELLGCAVRGVPLITLMASFPYVRERVSHWDDQISKAQWFSAELERLGLIQLGEKPHRHDLLHFNAPALYEVSKRVREKGYFLYKELKQRGIWGTQPGLARSFKLSSFAADRQQLDLVVDSFRAILNRFS